MHLKFMFRAKKIVELYKFLMIELLWKLEVLKIASYIISFSIVFCDIFSKDTKCMSHINPFLPNWHFCGFYSV